MKRLLLLGLSMLFSAGAGAVGYTDYGNWLCHQPDECLLTPAYGGPNEASLYEFLVNAGWRAYNGLHPGDSVQVCDGTSGHELPLSSPNSSPESRD